MQDKNQKEVIYEMETKDKRNINVIINVLKNQIIIPDNILKNIQTVDQLVLNISTYVLNEFYFKQNISLIKTKKNPNEEQINNVNSIKINDVFLEKKLDLDDDLDLDDGILNYEELIFLKKEYRDIIDYKIDDQINCIIKEIGSTGISRIVDLKELESFKTHFASASGEFSQGLLSKKIYVLLDLNILEKETINTGRRAGYEFLYSLTDLGINIYKMLFYKEPVESEKESVRRQYKSLEHGYFIKTVAKELSAKNYTVYNNPADCVKKYIVSTNDGNQYLKVQSDLIVVKGDTEFIIECEMGTTSDSDILKKLDKLVLVTKVISFIMNNNDSLNATSSKVDKWINKNGGPKNLKGYTFRFTTIDTLKKREIWQNKGPF